MVRNSGTRAAFVKAVCYSGTVEIKLAIYDVFCVQSIMFDQLPLFKCDVAYSVFVSADSALLWR